MNNSKHLKITVINWTGDRENWGCQATSYGLLEDLRDIVENPDLCIHTIPLGKNDLLNRMINILFGRFLYRHLQNDRITPLSRKIFNTIIFCMYHSDLDGLRNADHVIFMAEGTMNGTSFFGGIRLLMLPYYTVTELNKPIISLNQSFFSRCETFANLASKIYSKFSLIALREPESFRYAKMQGLENLLLLPDSAFRTEPVDGIASNFLDAPQRAQLLCITAGSGGVLNPSQIPACKMILKIARDRGLQPCGLFWNKKQCTALTKLSKEIGGLPPVFPKLHADYRAVSSILKGSVALVGGRYHTAIQAACVGVPFVLINSGFHKSKGLISLLSYPYPEREFSELDAISSDLISVIDNREALSVFLGKKMNEIHSLREEGKNILREYLR